MKDIAILYFSGTGNTSYIAHHLQQRLENSQTICSSITKDVDYKSIINSNDFIFFCYPVYGSTAPTIMEDFVYKYKELLVGKDVGVIITEGGFSGDGAYYLARILRKLGANVVCAEHFVMPDSIRDNKTKPITKYDIAKYLNKANKRLDIFVDSFNNAKYIRRGHTVFSRMLGAFQRVPWKAYYPKLVAMHKVNLELCNGCGQCVKLCPTNNLTMENGRVVKGDKCTLCYRCVNNCPKKAITIFGKNMQFPYKGIRGYQVKTQKKEV